MKRRHTVTAWNPRARVRILKDLRGQIEGRDVLVVEDIVDTGHTLHQVIDMLNTRHPRKLKSIALLRQTIAARSGHARGLGRF